MQKKKSNDIREYLLLLYHLRDAGEKLNNITLSQKMGFKPPTVYASL